MRRQVAKIVALIRHHGHAERDRVLERVLEEMRERWTDSPYNDAMIACMGDHARAVLAMLDREL